MRWHEIIAESNELEYLAQYSGERAGELARKHKAKMDKLYAGERTHSIIGPSKHDHQNTHSVISSNDAHRFSDRLIAEDDDGISGMIEDEAETRGDSVLAAALEELRNRAHGHTVPRVRVDSLVNLVKRIPGGEMFNVGALENARKSNDTIKELIKDIKDDENGVKYVYLNTFKDDEFGDSEIGGDTGAKTAPEKTVSAMANRAAKNRG